MNDDEDYTGGLLEDLSLLVEDLFYVLTHPVIAIPLAVLMIMLGSYLATRATRSRWWHNRYHRDEARLLCEHCKDPRWGC